MFLLHYLVPVVVSLHCCCCNAMIWFIALFLLFFIALLLLQCHDIVSGVVGSHDVVFHSTTTVTSASSHYRWCCLIALATNIIKSFLRVATIPSSLIVGFLVWSGFIKLQLLLFILRWSCFLVRSGLLQVQKELFDFFPPSSYGTRASRFYYRKRSFVAIIHFLFLLKAVPSPTSVESKLVHQSWGVWASSRSPWLLSKCSFFYITVVHALQLLLHRRYSMP